MTPPERDQVPREKAKVAWERPTLTLLGDVKDLIHASGKVSGKADSDPGPAIRQAPSADGPGRPMPSSIALGWRSAPLARAPSSLRARRKRCTASDVARCCGTASAACSGLSGERDVGWTCADAPRLWLTERSESDVVACAALPADRRGRGRRALLALRPAAGGPGARRRGAARQRRADAARRGRPLRSIRSGKSTIAYGLHRRGYRLWADDAVALEVSESAITALPLPFDVRLRPATAALFGLGRGRRGSPARGTRARRRDRLRRRSSPSVSLDRRGASAPARGTVLRLSKPRSPIPPCSRMPTASAWRTRRASG